MAAPKKSIEFLPHEDWERGTFGKLLKWALTVGRHIVIITELVVILAFLSRFKLDRDLTDLGEKVHQKQAIVVSSAPFEKEFRFLQKRLEKIEDLKKNQLEADIILAELTALTPVDVYLSDFDVNQKKVTLSATALSEAGLATFLKNLKNSSRFEKLSLSQVSLGAGQEIGIKFQIISELVPGKVKNGS